MPCLKAEAKRVARGMSRSRTVRLSSRMGSSHGPRWAMLASRIMTHLRRTTLSAPRETLRALEAEATRRGTSLNTILREAIEEKAAALRTGRLPRVGVARSTDGKGAADLTSEPVAEPPR